MLAKDQSFALSMFSFSLGLELGQILVVLLVLLLAWLFMHFVGVQQREWVVFLSAFAIALALQMAAERRPWQSQSNETTLYKSMLQPSNSSNFPALIYHNVLL